MTTSEEDPYLNQQEKITIEKDAFEIIKENGYTIANTKEDILALDENSGKVYAVSPVLQDGGSLPYYIDTKAGKFNTSWLHSKRNDVLG